MKSLIRVETLPVVAVGLAAWSSAMTSASELIEARGMLLILCGG